ncbi:hypothetical protein Mgra_00009151 [Meloidogyne graminicola]|uniref:Uncharacterized protein n=1 Tax=Meloidogyne graminicola TaxID=189291 RepID=A0A8S9ZDN2_9BILA|nr:hypothetical protein Mgra_00009151 [Meloidogyne graminicola]
MFYFDFNKDGKDIIYQGCGECPNNKIPCKTCNTQHCNHENFLKSLYFCYDNDGSWKECNNGICYYAKGEDNKVYRGCGKRPEEYVQYVSCNQNLCNTKELFDKTLFCLEKEKSETQTRKMIEKCSKECGVQRLTTGELVQGCFECKSNTSTKECKACKKKNYCNKEELVQNNCFENNGKLCFKGFYEYCFTETIESNKVNRGCGDCPSKKCEICSGHLCNVEDKDKYYCFVSENKNIKGCKEKNYCYVAVTEKTVRDKKIEKFHFDCGTCPTGFLDLFENNKLINMNNVQCAECNNGQLCNTESLFDSQLFCWEKDINKWTANKGKRVCKKGVCFIGVNKQEPVQGCGNCKEYNNLTKCNECTSPLCNNETILPKPIMCFYLNAYFQPFKVKNKECPHVTNNCYISLDIFMRVEQNCGKCPPKYKNCKTCKTNFCNNSTLLSIPTTKTNIILTSTKTTTTMKKSLTTKFNFTIKSNSNYNNKFKIEILIMLNILAIFLNIL